MSNRGYKKYYIALEQYLIQYFDDSELAMIPMEDSGTTGNFEIVDVATQEVLYSNKHTHTKCTGDKERASLKARIDAILED